MEERSLKQQAVQGTFWSFLDLWGNKVGTFVVFFVLVRLLPPESFGLLSLAWVFIIFAQNFADLGFTEAIVQRQDLEQEHLDTAFWTNVGVSTLLLLLTLAVVPVAGLFVSERVLLDVIVWLAVCFPLRSLTRVQNALLLRHFAFKSLTLRSVLATTAGGAVGIWMALAGYGVWSLVGQQIVFQATSTLVLWKAAPWQPGLGFSRRHFFDLFAFGRSVMGARTMDFFNRRSDNLLIGVFLGPVALGYYAVACKILLVLTESLTKMITAVTLPVFSRLQTDRAQLRRVYYSAIKLLGLLVFPAFVGLAVAAPAVVPVVFGEQWRASIPVMQILSFLGIAQCLFNLENGLMLALGKPEWRFQLNLFATATGLAAFFLSYQGGILAVAVAFTIRGYLLLPVGLMLTKRLIDLDMRQYLRQYTTPFAGALAVLLIALLVDAAAGQTAAAVVLLLQVVLGGLGYGLTAVLIDRAYLASLLRLGRDAFAPHAP